MVVTASIVSRCDEGSQAIAHNFLNWLLTLF
jgi:hypothetical protein